MPSFVSDLSDALESYVHPKLTFLDVLNEVLPELASRGIWKDLTFEESISLQDSDRFFTLPEDADSVLFGMANNYPTPVQPLWQSFISEGATTGRLGSWYGVEDAGYVATKEILSSEHYYSVFAFPKFRWDADDLDSDEVLVDRITDSAFTGDEKITIVYENWEGIVKTSTDTLLAQTAAQILSPRAVRNIRSIRYEKVTVPVSLVAVPILHYGELNAPGGNLLSIQTLTSDLPDDYLDLLPATGGNLLAYSILNTDDGTALPSNQTVPVTSVIDTGMGNSGYGGPSPVTNHPIVIHATTVAGDVLSRGDGYSKIADIEFGSGICRYRAFRIHDTGSSLHLLFRRKIPRFTANTDIVYLDNLSAIKYAILANTAEYNNDTKAATDWWSRAEQALSRELDKDIGAAMPNVQFDPSGGLGNVESIQ